MASIFERINAGEFKNNKPWPPFKEFKDRNKPDSEKRTKMKKEYQEEQHRLHMEFKKALYAEYGVEGNPKAEMAYAIAYDKGHSSGYSEIAIEFDTIVPLIKEIKK